MNNPTNLKQLADMAGVSAGTVSRALSGSGRVSARTRERIMTLASKLGYQPNLLARTMRTRKTNTVGMLVPMGHDDLQHLSDPFFNTMSGFLADALADRGYDLLLSRIIPADERWIENYVNSGRVDGVLIIGQSNQFAVIEATSLRYHPMVVWGGKVPSQNHCSVGSDNRAGGMLAARHLLDRGCRQIVYLGPVEGPEFGARLDGVRQALALAGHLAGPVVLPSHCEPSAAYDDALALLRNLDRQPDGIVAASDVTAISVIRALSTMGYSVPRDVKVIGYDGLPLGELVSPPLTTIDQQLQRGAGLMADLLLRRMAGEQTGCQLIDPVLVCRETT
ncbi:MAG: LacI family DNA-binding transcriptional regulator [Sphingomonadales bacterium]|nr:LacI family DNA-binding transcriptional regulator [Sphingomonadales bacterium]MDE2169883.1 LacI family DNA-binding transcriptional regulator [Sphingomonadales bacterium]